MIIRSLISMLLLNMACLPGAACNWSDTMTNVRPEIDDLNNFHYELLPVLYSMCLLLAREVNDLVLRLEPYCVIAKMKYLIEIAWSVQLCLINRTYCFSQNGKKFLTNLMMNSSSYRVTEIIPTPDVVWIHLHKIYSTRVFHIVIAFIEIYMFKVSRKRKQFKICSLTENDGLENPYACFSRCLTLAVLDGSVGESLL